MKFATIRASFGSVTKDLRGFVSTGSTVSAMVGGRPLSTISRVRLSERLREARVVLLEAPGGYGKTTLANQLVADWGLGAVRVRFDVATDLDSAVSVIIRAARRAGFGDISEAMQQHAARGAVDALDAFVEQLAVRSTPLVVVFDDLQRVESSAARELAQVVEDLPSHCRAVLAGRDLAAFGALHSGPATRQCGADDLRMTRDEVAEVLDVEITAIVVDEIVDATMGWSAAVGLAAQRLINDPTWSPRVRSTGGSLLDELVNNVVDATPSIVLLASVPLVDARVAEILGGPTLLSEALNAGVLATHLAHWHVVPDPIRESLAARMVSARTIDSADRREIAAHYAVNGELAAAISVLSVHDVSKASLAEFLSSVHWSELERLDLHAFVAIMRSFDDADLAACPELLVSASQAVELAGPEHRESWLQRAINLAEAGNLGRVVRSAQAEQARDLASTAKLHEADALGRAVLSDAHDTEYTTRGRALGAIARVQGFWCTAESLALGAQLFAEAAALFQHAGEDRWQSETLARRGYTTLFMAGFPLLGEAELRRALGLLPVGDSTRGFWLTNYSDVLDYLGRIPEAEAAAREALDIGTRRRDGAVISMAWWSLSWIAAHRGDLAGFRSSVDGFERNIGPWIRSGQMVEFLSSTAEHFAILGDKDSFHVYATRARESAVAIDYLPPIELAEATFEALHGNAPLALERIGALYPGVAQVPSNRPTLMIVHALAHARAGDLTAAAKLRRDAQEAAAAMQVPDILHRYLQPVIRHLDQLIDGDVSAPDVDARVSVRVLGGFAVTAGGVDCTPQPGHPSALIKLLVLHTAMTTDAAIDALWPEADIETGRRRLRNLLNRVRQRSGDVIIREGDSIRLRDEVSTDLHAFEAQASASLTGPVDEKVGTARLGINLYTGELLPGDVYEDWAAAPRERAKRQYLALLDVVASDAESRGDTEEALRLLDLGITAEPLDEARYIALCRLLSEQGRVGTARSVALRASAVLDEIGEVIGTELAALLESSSR